MALTVGTKAPEFTLQDTNGKKQSLSDYRNKKNVVLLFFPLAFSGTCTQELCTTRDNMKMYESLDAAVLAVSVDSFFTLRAYKQSLNLNFRLLSDFNKKVSAKYDSLYDDYYGMKGVSKRSVYVIDKKGEIRHAEVLGESGDLPDFEAIRKTLKEL